MKSTLALFGLFAFGAVAHGQIVSITDDGAFTGLSGSLTGNFSYTVDQSHALTSTDCSFHFVGDIRFQGTVPEQTGTSYLNSGAYFSVTTGENPTLLSSISMNWNGKEVNSGNMGGTANSTLDCRSVVFQGAFEPDLRVEDAFPERDGQGYWIEDVDSGNQDVILNPFSTYTVFMSLTATYNVTDALSASAPGYSLEYGGPWSPIFQGMTFSMNYQAVPEPGTLVLLGVPTLLAWRRQGKRA